MKKVVITGGHHSSALPVIKELQERYPEIEIHWLGHKHSAKGDRNPTLEYREITEMGIPFYDLKAGKFYKTINPLRLAKIPFGFLQALYLLVKIRPEIILSFGGYLAVPVVISGWFLKIPAVTHEQTYVVGYANKLISRFAKKVLISWPESRKFFKEHNVVETGLPLRKEIFKVNSSEFSLNSALPTIYITAGKTGSHIINSVVFDALENLLNIANVIHQTGDHSHFKDFDTLSEKYSSIENSVKGKYFPQKFIFENTIGEAFSKADLVIARSGAHTCFEVLALQKPTLFIPIPWVSHNEQFVNAKNVRKNGLAEILLEKDLSAVSLIEKVNHMMSSRNSYVLDSPVNTGDAAKKIVDEVEKTLKEK